MIKQSAYLVVLCATALSLSSDIKASDKSSQKLLSAEEHSRCINCLNCKAGNAMLLGFLADATRFQEECQNTVDKCKLDGTIATALGQKALGLLNESIIIKADVQKQIDEHKATLTAHQASLNKMKQ